MDKDVKIRWKPGYRFASAVDADNAYQAIEKLRQAHGEVTPEMLVEAAKAKRHALHPVIYELDDEGAVREHRLERARYVLRHIEIERSDMPDKPIRAYSVARSTFEPRKQAYKDTEELMQDPDERAELLKRALAQLVSIRRQYRHLQELAVVVRAIDEVLETTNA